MTPACYTDWIGGAVSLSFGFSFGCLLPKNAATSTSVVLAIMTLSMPPFVASFICLVWTSYAVMKGRPGVYLIRRIVLVCVSVFYVSYLPLVRTAISVFSCVDVFYAVTLEGVDASHSYWAVDMSIRCFVSSHKVLAIGVALPVLMLSLLFPVLMATILIIASKKDSLRSPWIRETFGIHFAALKELFIFWECIVLLRKFLIAVVAAFSYDLEANLQGMFLLAILLLALFLHVSASPFRSNMNTLNLLESASLIISASTILCGLILNDKKISHDILSSSLTAAILFLNIGFSLVLAYFLAKHKINEMHFVLLSNGEELPSNNIFSVIKNFLVHRFEQLKNALTQKPRDIQHSGLVPRVELTPDLPN